MRVVCERIASPATGEHLENSSWLTVGREYVVLSIVAGPRGVSLRLEADEGPGPSVWDAMLFRTTSAAVPQAWTVRVNDAGVLTLAPHEWQRPGFWESYFDGDPDAKAAFDRGR